jgi:hypothetical protein
MLQPNHVTRCVCNAAAAAQVVVDSHESAKALLDRGQLTKRVTIIPLNQVRHDLGTAALLPAGPCPSLYYLLK